MGNENKKITLNSNSLIFVEKSKNIITCYTPWYFISPSLVI